MSAPFEPLHLRPTAPLADRVLLPGDPGRALALAQVVLGDDRRMFNHHRGLWGYTGTAADGAPLTIQSTGMGGPSAAIVLEELARLGVRRAVRVGTARAVTADVDLGDLYAVTEVVAEDGAARALASTPPAAGHRRLTLDAALTDRLAAVADHAGPLVSHDLVYAPEPGADSHAWLAAGAPAADLETGALAAVAVRHGIAFASVVTIATAAAAQLDPEDREGVQLRLDDEALAAAGEIAGRAAADALAVPAG